MKTALTIAGSDSSGGAGIQADIKTMTMNGVYAMSAITAMTAQNTTGVRAIQESTPDFLKQQLDAVFEDICPDAIKIGMVASGELIRVIADRLRYYGAKKIIVDPVMVATSGAKLLKPDAVEVLKSELLPIADIVTPNIPEAELLAKSAITDRASLRDSAKRIFDNFGCAVLIKGGHAIGDLALGEDTLYDGKEFHSFILPPISNPVSTHGTGCSLSAALAAELALGRDLNTAVAGANKSVHNAIKNSYLVGPNCGVLGLPTIH
jgi:hydroxymethylpyrimidine/phosphomethylpyrimidine kinase